MSIELDVIPTMAETVQWGALERAFYAALSPADTALVGQQVQLRTVGAGKFLHPEEHLEFNTSYYLELAVPNTLGVAVYCNRAVCVDEHDCLDDFARNLPHHKIQELAHLWRASGHHYALTTMMGRSAAEPRLFVALAAGLAEACNGYIIVMSEDFDAGIGVYSGQHFRHVQPTFGSNPRRIWIPPP